MNNEALNIVNNFLNNFEIETREKWLNSLYNYCIYKSFPHKKAENIKDELIPIYEDMLGKLSDLNDIKYPEIETTISSEYEIFLDTYKSFYIYEMMQLDLAITGHNTLEHVMGVTSISYHIARQLMELNLPVDLEIVLGAALGHDIGKYGVLQQDLKRVPYLHYYYTEQWFKHFGLNKTGHIATNHSTWDLELETLPVESLILIYSDFRVKNKIIDGKYKMHTFTLDESFQVILNMLDNVDEKKTERYKRVYSKLKDFEAFMVILGVDITLNGELKATHKPYRSLMDGSQVVDYTKNMAIKNNIFLMSRLMDYDNFTQIIENARGESNWRLLRLYLQIFDDYSAYLTQKQKITTLHFLQELLLYKEEEIRKKAAELIGSILAIYDEEYRKEIPKSAIINNIEETSEKLLNDFLHNLFYPGFKIADSQGEWLYNVTTIIGTLFSKSNPNKYGDYFDVLNNFYYKCHELTRIGQLYLVKTVNYIPIQFLDTDRLNKLYLYILKKLNSDKQEIRLSVMDIIPSIIGKTNDSNIVVPIIDFLESHLEKASTPAENYIKYIISRKLNVNANVAEILKNNYMEDEENISDIFLKNLKTATDWTTKKINIDILYDQIKNDRNLGLHTSMHLCNLIKVSSVEKVRAYSGETLLNIFPLLSLEAKNDVCVELIRALEIDNYQFTRSIPDCLGQLILHLPPMELDEIITDFEDKLKVSSQQLIQLILNTIGTTIERYFGYKELFPEQDYDYIERLYRLLGLLLIPIASYNIENKTEALRVISTKLFKSTHLTLKEKLICFNRLGKKILTLTDEEVDDTFIFFNATSSLNHIYRFLSDYEYYNGPIVISENDNVAFFPGTFDPFSLGHTQLAKEMRNLGFEVYLAVDEFSWSKRTEPNRFRRDIINMSTAKEFGIYLFPKEISINISNSDDLYRLKELFPNREVYIAVGTDVILNATAYKNDSIILDWPHLVFDRRTSIVKTNVNIPMDEVVNRIKGKVVKLELSSQFEDISSSLIREGIDRNRDISKLIDPMAAEYIYKYGLYMREPQYKSTLETMTIDIVIKRELTDETLDFLMKSFGQDIEIEGLFDLRKKQSYRILVLIDTETKIPLGFSTFYWVRNSMLYDEFKDLEITEFLRKHSKGRTVLISGIYGRNNDSDLIDIVLNETLSVTINRDYNSAIYNNHIIKGSPQKVEEEIQLQGFVNTNFSHFNNALFIVDMTSSLTLSFDLENMLKPPYDRDERILTVIKETRRKLKKALSGMYPGQLLISFTKDMIYSKLIQKICDYNQVPIYDTQKTVLGNNMCVPFGIILNSTIIPNTVTKTIHTERIFSPDIQSFVVESYPNYLSIEEQSKTIKSFNKTVILVDDLLNKGYRLSMVEPILRSDGIEIKKLMVSLLSGRGKDIAEKLNMDIDYAYFIPNLKHWFNESNQYPFLGGDMVTGNNAGSPLIPSINFILPYVSPRFIKDVPNSKIYNLSEVCLMNSWEILKSIEHVYQEINEKNLNLAALGEVLKSPRYPDIDRNVDLSRKIKPSTLVEMDIDYLKRLEKTIKG